MTRALLVSTYDLGHQPFGLASPAAWLRREGVEVTSSDLTRDRLDEPAVRNAMLVAFHLPMHTATRMAEPVIRKVRALNPDAWICAYGLYAPLNAAWLTELGVDEVLGPEYEEALAARARVLGGASAARDSAAAAPGTQSSAAGAAQAGVIARGKALPRLRFLVPDRSGLPPLQRYATLRAADGTTQVAGYTEASRGCKHVCRHCPIVPVYEGQFRAVASDVVLQDIANQVTAGATHITFGDPDFFNGPTHAVRIVEQVRERFPSLTYDVTVKVEHLLRHRDLLPVLRDSGCLFVTSAVESIDDRVLAFLDKGHTRADFEAAVALCRGVGLTLVPTFVPFHPWTTLDGYCDLLEALAALDLVEHVAPIQLAIRLLVPSGSRMLELDDVRRAVTEFDRRTLSHRWVHPDPRVDALQSDVATLVGRRLMSDRAPTFAAISALAHERAGRIPPAVRPSSGTPVPCLDEPWYCCAEPNPEQLTLV